MTIADASTPVVVLRSVHHGGLGIVRSLGRLGVPVYTVDPDLLNPAAVSRYAKGNFRWDLDNSPAGKSIEYLIGIARKIGRKSILIPTTDSAALFLADNTAALREWFLFPDQRPDLIRSLYSKKEMYFLAKKLGVPTPEASFPQSRSEVLSFLERTEFPVMLKAIDDRSLRKRGCRTKAIVHNRKELIANYDAMEDIDEPNLMLQQYIPGGEDTVWMFNGYFDRNSDCLMGIAGKKLRQCPIYTGPTSLGICLVNQTVEDTTKAFMRALGYKGILDIGYRYDARDGLYKVLDINPRIGSTFRLFVADNGMDVARALYLDLTGQGVNAGSAIEGRKWIVEDFDLISCCGYAVDRNLGFREWIHSYRGIQESACFSWDDPLPALSMSLSDLREFISRRFRIHPGGRNVAAVPSNAPKELLSRDRARQKV